jgi:preprotein translocase subunit SecE
VRSARFGQADLDEQHQRSGHAWPLCLAAVSTNLGEDTVTETRDATAEHGKPDRGRKNRTTPALFYRQVVAELRKVIWPTRSEMFTYTAVVLIFVVVMTAIVFGLDTGFLKAIMYIFG